MQTAMHSRRTTRPDAAVRRRGRSGWTLIEMTVVVSLVATIGVMTIRVLALLLILGQDCVRQTTETTICDRLERRFRNDVHLAASAEDVTETMNAPAVRLTWPDGTAITYHSVPAGVRRDQDGKKSPQPSELFVIEDRTTTFSLDSSVVQLKLSAGDRNQARPAVSPTEWIVAARLGRAHRHLVSQGTPPAGEERP